MANKTIKVLFSPVGFTDPMSSIDNVVRDGSMMHIFREQKPDYTYLYMTSDIRELSDKDNRYVESLKLLAKQMAMDDFSEKRVRIFDSEVTGEDVVNMDAFYRDYIRCLDEITNQLGEDIHLIINISSGTPAMKAALYILKSVKGISSSSLFQVMDPAHNSKNEKKQETKYDVKGLFDSNLDNEPQSADRTRSVKAENIRVLRAKSIIKKLISDFNYDGAIRTYIGLVSKRMQNRNLISLLEFADARKHLNIPQDPRFEEMIAKLPNANNFEDYLRLPCMASEYFLRIGLYIQAKEYTDMLRFLTPMNSDLLLELFEKLTGLPFSYLCASFEKTSESLDYHFNHFPKLIRNWGDYKNRLISPTIIVRILRDMSVIQDPRLDNDLSKIVALEQLRNKVAHHMVSISEKEILKIDHPEEIVRLERRMLERLGIEINSEWDSYEKMNRSIMETMRYN